MSDMWVQNFVQKLNKHKYVWSRLQIFVSYREEQSILVKKLLRTDINSQASNIK